MFFKNEKEKCFAYLAHTACDNNNYVIDVNITSDNIHDSVGFIDLYSSVKNRYSTENIIAIAMDAGYITPHICKTLFDDNMIYHNNYRCQWNLKKMTPVQYRNHLLNVA